MAISNITSTTTKYTVVRGDTLWDIAEACIDKKVPGFTDLSSKLDSNIAEGVKRLQKLNPDIENANYIKIGQVITLQGSPNKKTVAITNDIKITNIGLQSSTNENTVFATWVWKYHKQTDHYEVEWRFHTDVHQPGGFPGYTETTTEQLSVYSSVPTDATSVSLKIKPISKTYGENGKNTYFNVGWSTMWTADSTYNTKDNPPKQPSAPVLADNAISSKNKLTVKMTELADLNATQLEFEISQNGNEGYKFIVGDIKNNAVSINTTVAPGADYKVRCRSIRNNMKSKFSDWSNVVSSKPATVAGIYELYAINQLDNQENQYAVRLRWYTVSNSVNYVIQYTTNEEYFDSNPSAVTEVSLQEGDKPYTLDHAEISGLVGGATYFFRICSDTGSKRGEWSDYVAIILGDKPTAPTTWSSTASVIAGEPLNLYWVHNSKDGSSQTCANLELTTIGMVRDESTGVLDYVNKTEIIHIPNSLLPEEKDKTSVYSIDTSKYEEGVKFKWRVQTAGVKIDSETGEPEYSDWSVHREVVIYAEPTIEFNVTDYKGLSFSTLTSLPINVSAKAGPNSQKPISFHLFVTADQTYETVDNVGNNKTILKGTTIYSKYFDGVDNPLTTTLSAGDLNLENNTSYTITCRAGMNSGLIAEESKTFAVAWESVENIYPNAEITYDEYTFTTCIRPYCYDVTLNPDDTITETLSEGVTLTVYRREFDGTLTELDTVNNADETFITDPHPSLDYARYRIVAISSNTGAVSYYDIPGFPVLEKSVILQWDDEWTSFRRDTEMVTTERHWSGSLLKLMYNVDVADQHEKEVELINYIGREHPVSYYGTQVGHTASWNMEIPKSDEETLYALRRLARWMGNVYVREPSGSGYWASIQVSFSQTHCELTIPVTLEITRVEGGI